MLAKAMQQEIIASIFQRLFAFLPCLFLGGVACFDSVTTTDGSDADSAAMRAASSVLRLASCSAAMRAAFSVLRLASCSAASRAASSALRLASCSAAR